MTLRLSQLSQYGSPYDVLGYLLRLMSSIWHRTLNAELASIDLTEMQFVLLMGLGWIVEEHPEGMTQKELADACGCSKALASQVMQILVRKQLVEVSSHASDARARMVTLSKTGENKVRAAVKILHDTDVRFRSDSPAVAQRLFDALTDFIEIKLSSTPSPVEDLGAMPRQSGTAKGKMIPNTSGRGSAGRVDGKAPSGKKAPSKKRI